MFRVYKQKQLCFSIGLLILFYLLFCYFPLYSLKICNPNLDRIFFKFQPYFLHQARSCFIQQNTASCYVVEYIGYWHVQALGFVEISTFDLLFESQIKIKLDLFYCCQALPIFFIPGPILPGLCVNLYQLSARR